MKKPVSSVLGVLVLLLAWETAAAAAGTTISLTEGADKVCLLNVNGVPSYCTGDRVVHTIGGATPVVIRAKGGIDTVVIRDVSNGGCSCSCDTTYAITDYAYGGSSVTVGTGRGEDFVFGGNGTNYFYGHVDPGDSSGATDDAFYDVLVGGKQDDQLFGAGGDDILIDRGGSSEVLRGEDDNDCLKDLGGGGWTSFDCGGGPHDETPNSGTTNCEDYGTCSASCPGSFP